MGINELSLLVTWWALVIAGASVLIAGASWVFLHAILKAIEYFLLAIGATVLFKDFAKEKLKERDNG